MSNPRISVLIPTYNRDEFVFRAIRSVFDEQNDDVEVVVVDNASPPETFDRLNSWIREHPYPVKLFRNEQNLGMTPNWNKCIEHASGEWLGLLCSDDYYLPGAIVYLKHILSGIRHPCLIVPDPSLDVDVCEYPSGSETTKRLRLPLASGNFWHRDISASLGGFDERIKYSPDAEFWYRIAFSYPVSKIKRSLAAYENHEQNYMYNTWEQPDFLDQVDLLTRLTAPFQGRSSLNMDLAPIIRQGRRDTIRTILQCCYRDRKRTGLFARYAREAWMHTECTNDVLFLTWYLLRHVVRM